MCLRHFRGKKILKLPKLFLYRSTSEGKAGILVCQLEGRHARVSNQRHSPLGALAITGRQIKGDGVAGGGESGCRPAHEWGQMRVEIRRKPGATLLPSEQLPDSTRLRITAANSSKVHLQRIRQTARTNLPDPRQQKTNGVHRPSQHISGRFHRCFQKTIPSHVRKGRTLNAKQHLWLEFSVRPWERKVLSLTMEALFCLSLLEDSWSQKPHQGFIPHFFFLLLKLTPTDGARLCGGSIGSSSNREVKKQGTEQLMEQRRIDRKFGVSLVSSFSRGFIRIAAARLAVDPKMEENVPLRWSHPVQIFTSNIVLKRPKQLELLALLLAPVRNIFFRFASCWEQQWVFASVQWPQTLLGSSALCTESRFRPRRRSRHVRACSAAATTAHSKLRLSWVESTRRWPRNAEN